MKNERLTIRIESTVKDSLKKIADNRNTTMSNLITEAINNLQCSKKPHTISIKKST